MAAQQKLYEAIEDLAGREDIPDGVFKDLIEKFGAMRSQEKEKKKYVLHLIELEIDDKFWEDGGLSVLPKKNSVCISKENFQELHTNCELDPMDPISFDAEKNWYYFNDEDESSDFNCGKVHYQKYSYLGYDILS